MNQIQTIISLQREGIRTWLQSAINDTVELTSQLVLKLLCQCLSKQHNKIKREEDERGNLLPLEDMLRVNEHFQQCLKQLAENLLHLSFAPNFRRNWLPKNLLGYYEIVKNLVHSEDILPAEVQVGIQNHFTRLLFVEFTISDLQINLSRYEGSVMLNLFMKELNDLIFHRITMFQKLYGLEFTDQAHEAVKMYLFNTNKPKVDISPTIDQVLLSMVYASLKIKKEKVLLGKICLLYENIFKLSMKEKLLKFYNDSYVYEHQEKLSSTFMEKVKVDKRVCKSFVGNHIEQEDSLLLDMFS